MNKINVGVIGLGRIGKIHIKNLLQLEEVSVHMATDPDPSAQQFARDLGVSKVGSAYQEIFDDPAIDAVIICSPTDTHFDCIEKAAAAGKHIFCEKPLDMTVEAIQQIQAIVTKAGVKLQVGFNRRFDVHFARIRDLVAAGKVGETHILKITSRDPGPPPISYIKRSGGLFLDMTIHDFDMARFIVGSEVKEVYAIGKVRVDPAIGEAGDVDTAIVNLTFEDGTIATIDNSRKANYGYDQRLEIFGSKGMAYIENQKPDSHILFDSDGAHQPPLLDFFLERYKDAYQREMQAFVTAIRAGEEVPVGGQDALMATMIGLAAWQSVKENRPIRIG